MIIILLYMCCSYVCTPNCGCACDVQHAAAWIPLPTCRLMAICFGTPMSNECVERDCRLHKLQATSPLRLVCMLPALPKYLLQGHMMSTITRGVDWASKPASVCAWILLPEKAALCSSCELLLCTPAYQVPPEVSGEVVSQNSQRRAAVHDSKLRT